jgi:hypothetical protein
MASVGVSLERAFQLLRFAPAGKGGFILDGTGCARECA